MSSATQIRFHRIRITDDALEEREGNVPLVAIQRKDIRSVRIVEGVMSEHPAFMVVLGLACIAIGVIGVVIIAKGEGFPKTGALCLSVAIAAPFCFLAALRRGTVLLVETRRGMRKLGFGRRVSAAELAGFVDDARDHANLAINADVPRAIVER